MRYSKIQYICWLFSGAEIFLLKECPTDYNRQASIGFTIFMTCLLAGLSGGFAAWTFTLNPQTHEGNWAASIIFGLVWGMLVFSIDRSMVVTLKKNPTLPKQPFFVPLATRMLLAGLLAFMISIPLETKIFEPEIEKQAAKDIQDAKAAYNKSVSTTSHIGDTEERGKSATEQAKLAGQQLSLADSQVPGVSSLLADATAQDALAISKVNNAQRQEAIVAKARAQTYVRSHIDQATGEYVKEYFSNKGPAAQRYREAKAILDALNNEARSARGKAASFRQEARTKANDFRANAGRIQNQALANGQQAEKERELIKHKNDSIATEYEKVVAKRGFVSQFLSMENAAHESGGVFFFLWFIRILFFIVEILPTIVKLATPVGAYDYQLYNHEQMFALALDTNYQILEEREQVRRQTELDIATQLEQARKDKEVELGQKMLEQTAVIQNSLAKQMLNDWYKDEREKQRLTALVTSSKNKPLAQSTAIEQNILLSNKPSALSSNVGQDAGSSAITSTTQGQSQVSLSHSSIQIQPENNGSTPTTSLGMSTTLITANRWHQDNQSQTYYIFENGSKGSNKVTRKVMQNEIENGIWEFPKGDNSKLHILFDSGECEYDIQRLTNTELSMINTLTKEAIIFRN